jgi:hypothetical protein
MTPDVVCYTREKQKSQVYNSQNDKKGSFYIQLIKQKIVSFRVFVGM